MTRPKVPDDKRQRTAQACDSCKRRKQKCNGSKPCNTCTKRNLICSYTAPADGSHEAGGSPTKRRHLDSSPPPRPGSGDATALTPSQLEADTPKLWAKAVAEPVAKAPVKVEVDGPKAPDDAASHHHRTVSDHDLEIHSRNSTISGADEEAALYSTTRMLQDNTGRLLYLGDSATLSYLHLFRYIVETISGPCPFTEDPRKERIVENVLSLPPHIRPPCIPPDQQTAEVLVESFFTNTSGLIEVFDKQSFKVSFDGLYTNPLSTDPSFLCHLYLIFAIGLILATPLQGSPEDVIIKRLRASPVDQAELFFRSAKCLGDPLSGFEDADFWSVQALLLMSVYMLSVSKRNAAYAYHGMAVRSAIALGLHREEPMVMFRDVHLVLRCNLWRSLFILDRFLAASLGRPTAISEDDCSDAALKLPPEPESSFVGPNANPAHTEGIDATVWSCRFIGVILKKVYASRKVNVRIAQDIVKQCVPWPHKLHSTLNWRQAADGRVPPAQGMAILHVNLVYCHAVILLTRPYFLHVVQADRPGPNRTAPRLSLRMEKFAETCVSASHHTMCMAQAAYEGHYLPQRDPFVMYFLFAAALVVLSNEFVSLYRLPGATTRISQSIAIMAYCAESDPQGDRLLWILRAFQDVVSKQSPGPREYRYSTPSSLANAAVDPISSFFSSHLATSSHSGVHGSSKSASKARPPRHNSRPSLEVPSSAAPTPAIPPPTKAPRPESSPEIPPRPPANGSTIVHPLATTHLPTVTTGPPPYGLDSAVDAAAAAATDAPDSLGTDADAFDFDSLWSWPGHLGGHAAVPTLPGLTHMHIAGPPVPQRFDPFPAFGLSLPPPNGAVLGHAGHGLGHGVPGGGGTGVPNGNAVPSTTVNMNVPMYPTADFA